MRLSSRLQPAVQLCVVTTCASAAFGQAWIINSDQTISGGTVVYNSVEAYRALTQDGGVFHSNSMLIFGESYEPVFTLNGGTTNIPNTLTLAPALYGKPVNFHGAVVVNNGTLNVGSLILGNVAGYYLNARVAQHGGTVNAGSIRMGSGVGNNATYHLYGGTLATGGITKTGADAGATRLLYIDGATLRATDHNDNFIHSSIQVQLTDSQLTFDTQGFNVGYHGGFTRAPGETTTGEIIKTGTGTLSLYGDNSALTHGFLLEQGTIAVGWDANLGGAGAKLAFNGGTLRVLGTGYANFGSRPTYNDFFNGGFDIADPGHTFTFGQWLSGAGSLAKSGAGTLVLSNTISLSGPVSVSAGTLSLTGNNALSGGFALNGGALSVTTAANLGTASNAINFNGGILRINGTSLANLGSHPFNASTFNGGFDIADASHTFTLGQALSGTGNLTKLGAGTLVLHGADTRAGTTTLSAGTLRITQGSALQNSHVVLGGGALDTGSLTAVSFGGLSGSSALSLVNNASAPIALTVGGGNTDGAYAGVLSGAGSLTKTGSGVLTLGGANTYQGGTTLTGGTLAISTAGNLGAGPLQFNGGTLRVAGAGVANLDAFTVNTTTFNGGLDVADAGHTLTVSQSLSGTSLAKRGAGTLVLSGANSFTDGIALAAGTLAISTAANTSTTAPTLTGTGNFTKLGAGTLALSSANTFTGAVTVKSGALEFADFNAFGNASNRITLDGGALRWADGYNAGPTGLATRLNALGAGGGTFDTNGHLAQFNTGLTGAGSLTKTGAGTLRLTTINTYTGGTVVNGGVLELAGAAQGNGDGLIRGTLTINPGATVRATATNTLGYSANRVTAMFVNGGTFSASADTSDQGWAISYVLDGGTLSSNDGVSSASASSKFALGHHSAVGVIGDSTSTIAGRVDLRGDFNPNTDFTVAANATLNVTAAITSSVPGTGATGFTKKGDGLMILAGNNTYTGPTFVSAGTLRVNGSATDSAFTVQSGGTLGGSGTVGALTVQSGGTLAPGNSPGLLTINGPLTLDSGSFTNLEIAGTTRGAMNGYDAINVSGLFTPGGVLNVSFSGGYTPSGSDTTIFDFFDFTSIGATAFSEVNLPTVAGYTWNTDSLLIDGAISLVASAIPEPASFAALAGIAALAVGARRRRRAD